MNNLLKNWVVWLFVAVVGLWLLCPIVVRAISDEWAVRGQFGDQYGAINALFSALAFAAIAMTLNYQRHDLALQRSEVAKSTKALAEQAAMQRAQSYCGLAELRIAAAEAATRLEIIQGQPPDPGHDAMVAALQRKTDVVTREADRLEAILMAADETHASRTSLTS